MDMDNMNQYNNMFQAFGSPMLGSTIVTAPRREGDGMDEESLLREVTTGTTPGPSPPRLRHKNLNSTQAVQRVDVDRGRHQRTVPHEPVRGAVKPVLLPPGGQGTQPKEDHAPREKSKDRHVTFNIPTKPETLRHEQVVNPEAEKMVDDFMQRNVPCMDGKLVQDRPDDDKRVSGLPNKLMAQVISSSSGDRQVEGRLTSTSQDIENLNKTVTDLQDQLQVQSKVNTDLKKMLVASMGDDLHHKVDTLVRTKAQLASDIGGYTNRIYEDHETLDKLVIQADMWRSKFKASRVLVDQLVSDKDTYSRKWTEAKRSLQQLLQERQQLKDSLVETHRYLKILRDSFDPIGAKRPAATVPNVLELARTIHLLADSVKFRLLPAMPVFPSALDAGIQNGCSPAEKLALQVLSEEDDPKVSGSGPNVVRLPAAALNKYDRFHPQVRYENITYNCCAKCKGEVLVV